MSLQPLTGWEGVRHDHGYTLQGSWLYRLAMAGQRHADFFLTLLSQWQASLAQLGRRQEHNLSRLWHFVVLGLGGQLFSYGKWRKWEERVHVAADQERGNTLFLRS